MRDRVHFFSSYDLSIPHYLSQAEDIISKYLSGWQPVDVNDVIELYNIWLFVDNGISMKNWSEETLQIIRGFKDVVVSFFSQLDCQSWSDIYKQIEASYRPHFWEIIDRFNASGLIAKDKLKNVLSENDYELRYLLNRKRLVCKYDMIISELLRTNKHTPEWLLGEYVEEKTIGSSDQLFFPKSFSLQDREKSISDYLDLPEPNLNYVRLVLVAKKDNNLKLSDEVILKAKKVERELNDRYFNRENSAHFKYTVSICNELDRPLKWVERDEECNSILCYSRPVMLQYVGAELLHYCRFGFEYLTHSGMISLVSKSSESGTFERIIAMNGKYSYPSNMAFRYNEAISRIQIEAMQSVLESDGRCIESGVKEFYEEYLKERYGYPSTKLSLLDNSADWVAKCRNIAPEIDAIAKRYDQYAKRGDVNEELLEISSDTIRITDVSSSNRNRYYTIKGRPNDLYRLFYLLFGDQSMLSYVAPFKDQHYHSFFDMLVEQDGKIPYGNYASYQLRDIDFLIDEGYLTLNSDGCLFSEMKSEIALLKHLYDYHSCPTLICRALSQDFLQHMLEKEWIEMDNHLLSIEERKYFDYYMYNTLFTNGPALRNRYVHGAHVNPEQENVHKVAYYRMLILLIMELLKIEEDLIYKQLEDLQRYDDACNAGR